MGNERNGVSGGVSGVKEEIKSRADIVEVIGEYVRLGKRGRGYVGLCPFHEEKTASFTVNREKGIYYCFGCGKHGDVIQFLMEYRRFSFYEVLVLLGERVGVEVRGKGMRGGVLEVNEKAMEIYRRNLKASRKALQYLVEERGLGEGVIEGFRLGYAKDGWDELGRVLRASGVNWEDQLKSGLVGRNRMGGSYDYFRDRIIFPIEDHRGKILGFGGRLLGEGGGAKYLNSRESEYFQKREILYGLGKGGNFEGGVVIVEGYLDVIKAHELGFKNVLGVLGTGLTGEHVKRIGRHTNRIFLVFDGDEAGFKAMGRGIIAGLNGGLGVRVLGMGEGEDPFDYMSRWGKEGWEALIEGGGKEGLSDWLEGNFKRMVKQGSREEKRGYWNAMGGFLKELESEWDIEEGLRKCGELLGLSDRVLRKDFERLKERGGSRLPVRFGVSKDGLKNKSKSEKKNEKKSGGMKPERYIMYLLLNHLDLYFRYQGLIQLELMEEGWEDGVSRRVIGWIDEFFCKGELELGRVLGKVREELGEEEGGKIYGELVREESLKKYGLNGELQIEDCMKRIKLLRIKEKKKKISRAIREYKASREGDRNMGSERGKELMEEQQYLVNEELKVRRMEIGRWGLMD